MPCISVAKPIVDSLTCLVYHGMGICIYDWFELNSVFFALIDNFSKLCTKKVFADIQIIR